MKFWWKGNIITRESNFWAACREFKYYMLLLLFWWFNIFMKKNVNRLKGRNNCWYGSSFTRHCFIFQIEVTSLCMCVSISATVALVCIFAPKVYIVLLQPHKNVRQGASTSMKNNHPTLSRIISEQAESLGTFPFQNGGVYTHPNQTTQTTHTTINDVFGDDVDLDDLSSDDATGDDESSTKLNPPMEADIWLFDSIVVFVLSFRICPAWFINC